MTFLMWLFVVIRIATEAVILGFAWHRSDWSVALSLTMLTATTEYRGFVLRLRAADFADLAERDRLRARLNSFNQ